MPTDEPKPTGKPRMVAHPLHTAVLVIYFLVEIVLGLRTLHGPQALPINDVHPASYARLYALNIATEWGLLLYVAAGVWLKRGRLLDLVGGRWQSWRQVGIDFAIALPFWIIWTLTAQLLFRIITARLPQGTNWQFPPHGWLDISLWLALSASAGFCEEVLYRGYLQKQFHAFTGSALVAVAVQGVFFGAGHIQRGIQPFLVITVLGILYGVLAQWRRSLRPGIISHAWSDMFEGYFKHFWR